MVILLLAAALCWAEAPVIVTPPPDVTAKPGSFRIIARVTGKAALTVDGKPAAAAAPAAGVIFGEVKLDAGAHTIAVRDEGGETKLTLKVDTGGTYKAHPPGASCDSCHAVKESAWAMKRASLAPLCFQCHEREKFAPVHTHNTDILAECQTCHRPHGSAVKGHLKLEREKDCKQCHS